ncbi:MAG: Alpha,alpha-trehalose-phosphate synthase [UDP-forming] [uncultured Rubrobacteraceae bacterium]|uniref:Alpha,alpha-trehalose-phosphate synthase [UDP-forming] n=1 Tax=uncultured Rubrobacteraceae bacterium TaxID=349277 RepID=A0A6J4RUE0_9ACTN|nr:MAG: Alpha,alpha-trehalose-phosphate synthase [UDP-forming] [uncultured Rubrobacteraceae bacterium]
MTQGRRGPTIVVSNRGPVTFSRDEEGERGHSRGAGGLVTALNAVLRRSEGAVWIASAQSEEDAAVAREPAPYEVEDLRVRLVEHDGAAYDLMYNTLANPLLWFVQHGLYDLPRSPRLGDDTREAWEKGYVPVNRNFARAVAETVGDASSSTILLHDYQLYMTPLFLREELGDRAEGAFISLFVHIPWPEPDLWGILPNYVRRGVLESLLSADVVAFHTRGYARNFMETAARVLGAEADVEGGTVRYAGREVWVRAYPISIDPDEFGQLAGSEAVLEQERFVKDLPGRLLLRVDRTDLSKNVVRGFEAYGRMLERHPEMAGGVTFLAQLQPSRGDIPEYAAYMEAVGRTAEEVNARHGTDSWRPIELFMQDNFPRSVAAYKNYDVLLVNAVRDGMNLVAKEAAVVNERNGVLVLSEYAGAHEELGEHALTVNPYDLDEQADALHAALTMPEDERRRRAEALRETVLGNTIDDWVEAQVRDIEAHRGHRG